MKANCELNTTCYASIDFKTNKLNAKESDVNYTSIVFGKKRVIKEIPNETNNASVTYGKSKAMDNKRKSWATTARDSKKIEDNAPILPPRRGNGDKPFKHLQLPRKHNSQCQTDFTNGNQKLFLILVLGCVITGVINLIIWIPGVWINYDDEKPLNRCLNTGKGEPLQTTERPINDANKVHREIIATNPATVGVTRRITYKGEPLRKTERPINDANKVQREIIATNPATVGVTQKITYKEFEVIGCFIDAEDRDLDVWPWGNISPLDSMTREMCAAKCKTLVGVFAKEGHLYAGLEAAGYCACGDTYGRYGKGSGCQMRCTGDNNQICGGNWRITVLNINKQKATK